MTRHFPLFLVCVVLGASSALAQDLGPIVEFIEAPFMSVPPVPDGLITEGEYARSYFYSFVDTENPGNPFPGLNQMCGAAGITCNDEPGITGAVEEGDLDLSATVHYAHDDSFLYIGFDVTDTFLNADEGQTPFNNDGVELVIDADADGADGRAWSLEGFKINTDTLNPFTVRPPSTSGGVLVWDENAGDDAGSFFMFNSVTEGLGYVIEFLIPLNSLDVADGPDEVPASTGSLLRTNFAINDIDVDGGNQGAATHAMQWVYGPNPASPFGGAEEVWVVGLALTEEDVVSDWPGDVNGDGHTDVADLNIIGINWQGIGKDRATGDLTGDGNVNAQDLNELAINWQTWRDGMPAAVPEPSSVVLTIMSCFITLSILRRKK